MVTLQDVVAGCCWMLKTKFISSTYPTKLVILGVRGTAVLIWGMPAAEAVPSGFGTKGGFAKMTLWHRTVKNYNITTGKVWQQPEPLTGKHPTANTHREPP